MSGRQRRRDALAPSLFPFLAVLLCTMGALVLLLMLNVSDAHTTAQKIAKAVQERREEAESLAQAAIRTQRNALENLRFDLEKKRLSIQQFEQQINELTDELAELEQAIRVAQSEADTNAQEQVYRERLSELEQQLAEAEEQLEQKPESPDGEKPVFAVVPYQGPNGTHRRPIYLECRQEGVILQPEGTRIALEDLRPPYGPGNPLDAVLRTVRTAIKPASGAITENAYPLLLVRPSGIRTYSMARAALSAWDDQFGYELLDESLELVYPKSIPGLAAKVEQAINLARERQKALVQAMPRRFQRLESLTTVTNNHPGGGSQGSLSVGAAEGYGTSNLSRLEQIERELGEIGSQDKTSLANQSLMPGRSGRGSMGNSSDRVGNYDGSPPSTELLSANNRSTSSSFPTVPGSVDAMAGGRSNGAEASDGTPDANHDAKAGSWQELAANSQAASGNSSGSNRAGSNGPMGSGNAAAAMMGQPAQGSSMPTGSQGSPPGDSSPQAPSQLAMSFPFEENSEGRSVANSHGRNWAWREGPRSQTPVVRSLHLHCFSDRWVLLPDDGDPSRADTILFEGTPEERAVRLAKLVLQRVDEWGLAIMGGYWKPVLVVDSAPDAKWRFNQLVRLMANSGIEVRDRKRSASNSGDAPR